MERSRTITLAWGVLGMLLALGGCAAGTEGTRQATDEAERASWSRIAGALQPLAGAEDAVSMRHLAHERALEVANGAIRVDIQPRGLAPADRGRFVMDGVRVAVFAPDYERVGAWVATPGALRALSRLPVVRRVAPAHGSARGD